MKNKILWGLTFLPMIVTAVVLRFMPDEVPMHYNMSGEIDRWGSKYEELYFPCVIVVMTLFWLMFMRYYRKKQERVNDDKAIKEAQSNEKVLYYVAVSMAVMFGCLHYFSLYRAYEITKGDATTLAVRIDEVTNIFIGIVMVILGNVLPKAKRNFAVGVRTVWSMHNDITWAKSNRFGGVALMVCGVVTIIETLIIGGFASTMIMLGLILAFAVVICVYSYKVFKETI